MMIHEITEQVGPHRRRKRIGRGRATGHGKTSGRGTKGATSRSGWSFRASYEGGQKPFYQRIPKRGFSNAQFADEYHVVNLKALEARCENGSEVTVASLAKMGLVRNTQLPLKVLGEGELTKKLHIKAAKFSAAARTKIEGAGGSITEITRPTWTRAAAAAKAAVGKKEQKQG
jgi:large subunit ribosomal protein L15